MLNGSTSWILVHNTGPRWPFQGHNVQWKGGYEVLRILKQHIFVRILVISQKRQVKLLSLSKSLHTSRNVLNIVTASRSLHSYIHIYKNHNQSIVINLSLATTHRKSKHCWLHPLIKWEPFRSIPHGSSNRISVPRRKHQSGRN